MSTPDIIWATSNGAFRATRITMSKRHGRNRSTSFWRIYKNGKVMDSRLNREAVRRYRKEIKSHDNSRP